ncbi:glycerate kinase family protein [Mycobacterium xenopi 4042]|uniref:Glycerate kinase family protein n=1 Tax=Mycobacterium xenopi 4042 TaxID=1299334 RepID=X8DB84_MYCXE|nr:glycerate kinase family protein [Mycobacterium xenopi 4042]
MEPDPSRRSRHHRTAIRRRPGLRRRAGRPGGELRRVRVRGPLDAHVDAAWVFDAATTTAYLESAQACGLALLGGPPTPQTAWSATAGESASSSWRLWMPARRGSWSGLAAAPAPTAGAGSSRNSAGWPRGGACWRMSS